MSKRTRQPKFSAETTEKPVTDTEKTEKFVRSGMLAAARAMPICAPAIRALNPVISELVPTMGVDKYFRVYINPDFVEEIMQMARDVSASNPCPVCRATSHHEIAYVAGVICHEAWHPMREHQDRATEQGFVLGSQFYLWNVATDMEINDDLLQVFASSKSNTTSGLQLCLPPVQVAKDNKSREYGVLIPAAFDLEGGKLAETYYHQLLDKVEEMKKEAAGDGEGEEGEGEEGEGEGKGSGGVPTSGPLGDIYNCGSGADGQQRPYEAGPPGADCKVPGISEAEGRMVRKAVAKEINKASKNRGNMPGGWKRWANKELEPAKYNWRQELNRVVRYAISRVPGDRQRTFRRLGRRTASLMNGGRIGAVLPSSYNPRPRVVIVQDTSGSMGGEAIQTSLSEADAILKAAGAAVGFINCDAAADVLQEVSGSVRQIALHGGGGTDMRVGIKAALESKPSPDIVMLFTDGFTPWPSEPLPMGKQLIVGLVGDYACDINEVPSWAHAIRIVGDDIIVRERD